MSLKRFRNKQQRLRRKKKKLVKFTKKKKSYSISVMEMLELPSMVETTIFELPVNEPIHYAPFSFRKCHWPKFRERKVNWLKEGF